MIFEVFYILLQTTFNKLKSVNGETYVVLQLHCQINSKRFYVMVVVGVVYANLCCESTDDQCPKSEDFEIKSKIRHPFKEIRMRIQSLNKEDLSEHLSKVPFTKYVRFQGGGDQTKANAPYILRKFVIYFRVRWGEGAQKLVLFSVVRSL